MPNNGNDSAALVGVLGVGMTAEVSWGIIIIDVLGLHLSLQLRVVDSVNDVFTNFIGEKTILLTAMDIDNGPNGDGIVGAGRVHGKELLHGGLVHVINRR